MPRTDMCCHDADRVAVSPVATGSTLDVRTMACNSGYALVGSSSVTCQRSSTWSSSPSCACTSPMLYPACCRNCYAQLIVVVLCLHFPIHCQSLARSSLKSVRCQCIRVPHIQLFSRCVSPHLRVQWLSVLREHLVRQHAPVILATAAPSPLPTASTPAAALVRVFLVSNVHVNHHVLIGDAVAACPANAAGAPNCVCNSNYFGTLTFSGGAWSGTCVYGRVWPLPL